MSFEEDSLSTGPDPATRPALYRYLFITRNRDAFLLEEPGGHILHTMRQFLELVKKWFPQVIYTRFKGRIVPEDFSQLHLIVVLPVQPIPGLLGLLLEGLSAVLLGRAGPEVRIRIPRGGFQIELGGRRGTQGAITSGNNHFETTTKMLVALLLLDEFQTEWVRGTSSRRALKKRRMAFFLDRPREPGSGLRRGKYRGSRTQLVE